MRKVQQYFFMLLFSLLANLAIAQADNTPPVDMMRSNGKIWVVVAVVITILLGLFLYLVSLDRKIKKMEKEGKG